MDGEEQNNEGKSGDSFLKQAKGKAENKLKDEIKKQGKELAKKFIKFLLKTPAGKWILLALVIVIVVVILLVCIYYVINKNDFDDSSDSTKASVTYESVASSGDSGSEMHTVNVSQEQGGYNITPIYVDVETSEQQDDLLANIRNELSRYGLDVSAFTDFELKYLGVLYENGLDYSLYNEEELKALITFLKAEIANKSLDLRPADEMLDEEENYKKIDFTTLPEDKIQGIIQLKRTNIKDNSTKNLTYIDKETFDSYIENKDQTVINYFTIDDEDNLVVARWKKTTSNITTKKTTGETTETNETYYVEPMRISYKQYNSKVTLSFNFLAALLAMTEDVEFCKNVTNLAFDSEIIIDIKEESVIYETKTEEKHFPKYKEIMDLNYSATQNKIVGGNEDWEPIYEEEYYSEYADISNHIDSENISIDEWINNPVGQIINLDDPEVSEDSYTIINETTTETHTYKYGITKSDTWITNYSADYGEPIVEEEPNPAGEWQTINMNELQEFNEFNIGEYSSMPNSAMTKVNEFSNSWNTFHFSRLTLGKFDKSTIELKTDINKATYKLGEPMITEHIYGKDEQGNLEKFLLLYSRSTAKGILWKE